MKNEEIYTPPVEEIVSYVHNYDLNTHSREIYVHSHYGSGEESGIEYRMATQFIKNLHLLDSINQDRILVHLQSPGGDWGHGIAMYDAIVQAKSPITILAHGEINSMSSILFQAANLRIMMPHCEIMLHRGFLVLEGVSSTVQSNADWNKKTDEIMLKIYAKRAVSGPFFRKKKMSFLQVVNYIDKKIRRLGDWNLDAEAAVHYGLSDCVWNKDSSR